MKRCKIIQVYIIDVGDAAAAQEKLSQAVNPAAHLDAQFLKEVEEGGWKAAVKKQL